MNLRKRSSETNMASPSGASPEDTPERRTRDAKCIKYSWFLLPVLLGGLLVLALHPTWVINPVSAIGTHFYMVGCGRMLRIRREWWKGHGLIDAGAGARSNGGRPLRPSWLAWLRADSITGTKSCAFDPVYRGSVLPSSGIQSADGSRAVIDTLGCQPHA